MTVADTIETRPNVLWRLLGAIKTLIVGTLLCMTPVTSVVVLGWLMRRMRWRAGGIGTMRPGWLLGAQGSSRLGRLLGGFAANVREGVLAVISLFLATMPFSVIWLLSWWAGWENSFSKGYEQAFVGPALGMTGVILFCVIMIWLPMAQVHQAVENRALALFEWRKVRSVVRHTGWGYLALAFTTVFFALPIFAGRGLVVFASGIIPGFDTISVEDAASLAGLIALVKAGYVFIALVILRGWAARIYSNAVHRAMAGPEAPMWKGAPLNLGQGREGRSWKLTHWMRCVLLLVIWFGLAAQIFVGQFLNHDWHMWLTHPMFLLPWAG